MTGKKAIYFYWIFVFIIFVLQIPLTIGAQNQIRYEELGESVRNPFWFSRRILYDGVSSNIGWYATMHVIYSIFGFDLFAAKFFRLLLHFVSLLCIAVLLKRYLTIKHSFLPFLAIALSPTLLYFNLFQTPYGIDLQYFPICLYLILSAHIKKLSLGLIKLSLGLFLAMIAWLSYPTFIFYIPIVIFLAMRKLLPLKRPLFIIIPFAFFLLPLLAGFMYIKDTQLLIHDARNGGGVFRGAGSVSFDPESIIKNVSGTFTDIFIKADSYNFELKNVEFSLLFPTLAVFIIIGIAISQWKKFTEKKILLLSLCLFMFSLASYFAYDPSNNPGLHRTTILLTCFYLVYVAFYKQFITVWHSLSGFFKFLILFCLVIIPLHHIVVYPFNLASVGDSSVYKEGNWFTKYGSPRQSVQKMVTVLQKEDLKLGCWENAPCRYSEIYAAVAGSCAWNHLSCKQIYGFDFKTNQFIPLTPTLWETYYFEH